MLEVRARFREFRRTPGYVVAVLFSLSTGMAVCVAVFSTVNTLVFADIPGITNRTTLVRLTWSDGQPLSPADLEPFEDAPPPSLGPLAAQADRRVGVVLPSGAAVLPAGFVSKDFFAALGTSAVTGRVLTPADADATSAPVVAIGESLWRSAFEGEPGAIGRTLIVAGRAFTIVGVVPQGFPGLDVADVGRRESSLPQIFLPRRFLAMWPGAASRTTRSLSAAARLKDGARLAGVRQEVAAVSDRLPKEAPDGRPRSLRAFRMGLDLWDAPGESALVILIFLFVPLGVLGIGCGNVVNLQLARAVERAGELSIRLALGASGGVIARLLSAEILPVIVVAGALGWAGARGLLALAEWFMPLRFALDGRAIFFAAVIVSISTAVGGVLPAWLAARDVVAAGLRAREGAPARTRIRHLLIVAQVTASVALVAVAVLAARSLQARAPALPADARTTLVAQLNLADANPGNPRSALFVRTILDALAADRAVRSAGFADFFLNGYPIRYRLAGDRDNEPRVAFGGVVSPGWFDATATTVLAGRTPVSTGTQTFEAAVNAAFAARAGMTATTALGSRLRVRLFGGEQTVEIVGVVASGPLGPLGEDGLPAPMLILPMPAVPPVSLVLTIRAADTEAAKQAVTAAVKRFDPLIPFVSVETLEGRVVDAFRGFKEITMAASALAVIALLLSGAGLYALLSYTVRRRTREIGIRIAVGAGPGRILTLVLRRASALVLAGGVLGLVIAAPIAHLLRSAFFGLSPFSPSAGLPTIALLLVVAAAAAAVPTYRAVRIDPLDALREP